MGNPICPKCGSAMVLRTARHGRNAGGKFYGCSNYPNCKGTLDHEKASQNDSFSEDPQADITSVSLSFPRTLVARSRIQGYQVKFFESAAVTKSIFEVINESETPDNVARLFSQWRLDFPPMENTPQWSERERQVLSVSEKILTRGKITLCSPYIETELEKIICTTENLSLNNTIPINDLISFCQADSLVPWLDHSVETLFFQKCLPTILGPNYARWVLPQVEISSLVPTGVAVPINGRVDFLLLLPNSNPIVIEIEGKQHVEHQDADNQRFTLLSQFGYSVVRIHAHEVNAGRGPNISKLVELIGQPPNTTYESLLQHAQFVKVIQASRYIHQIQLTLLHAIQMGHLGLRSVNDWSISTDIEKVGLFSKNETTDILAVAVKDLIDLFMHLGRLYSVELCHGNPHIGKDSESISHVSNISILFVGNAVNGKTNFYIQPIYVPFDIANSTFITGPAILDKPRKIELEYFLRYIFRKDTFWEGQFDAISRTLEGKDSIVLLPTGGGKSIAFQLASFLLPGRTVVIDPIVSLMDDQIDNLASIGVDRCIAITSQIENVEDKMRANTLFGQGEYLFAYIAPERFQTVEFRESLRSLTVHTPVALIAVDEAHCVSEWGHDFRTAYLNIGRISRQYCESNGLVPPLLALTGTASRAVLRDVQRELNIKDFEAIITPKSFDRSELKFHVFNSSSSEKSARLIGLLNNKLPGIFSTSTTTFYQPDGLRTYSGLIFCPHVNGEFGVVKQAEEIQKSMGISTDFYSGSQPKHVSGGRWADTKQTVARRFKHNNVSLLVCTKAFGMGIDKPNIRYTVHFGIPSSIEAFYQEAGRAGRDRKTAHCCVIVSDDNPPRTKKLLDPNTKAEEVTAVINSLKWEENDDITRALFFQSKSFPGIEQEKAKALSIAQKIGDLSVKRDCRIAYPYGERAVNEKALHRLLLLGIVSDYTINYSASELTVHLSGMSKEQIIESYGNYVAGYLESRKHIELEKARGFISLSTNDFITHMLELLLRFIYDIIERGRRRALQEMLLAATVAPNDAAIRKRILRYLEATEYSEILDAIIGESDAGILKTMKAFEEVRSTNEASELRGQASRYLESYPDHPGLLMLRALAEAYARDHNSQLVEQNLLASISSCIENYGIEKSRLFEFTAWAINKISFRNSELSDHLQKLILNQFPEKSFAQALVRELPRARASIPAWFILDRIRKEIEKVVSTL